MYQGDYFPSDTIDFAFTSTVNGVPTALAGTPAISVYKSNSTTASTAGVTLSTTFNSITGLNHVHITTVTDGTFYSAATDFDVVITTGTLGGSSVVGVVVASFSLSNRSVGKINGVATTSVTTIKAVQGLTTADTIATYTGNTPQTGDAYARLGAPAGASIAADLAEIEGETDTIIAAQLTGAQMATAIWADTTAADFTTAASVGKSVMNGVSLGTGLTVAAVSGAVGSVTGAVGSVTGAVGSVTGNVGGNVVGSAASVTGAVGSVTGNVGGNVVGSVASVTAAVGISSNIKKGQALAKFQFLMTDSTTHNPKTGLTVTCTRSIDGGGYSAGTLANITEIANGTYTVDFGAGDLSGNVIVLRATAASSDDRFERIVTQP